MKWFVYICSLHRSCNSSSCQSNFWLYSQGSLWRKWPCNNFPPENMKINICDRVCCEHLLSCLVVVNKHNQNCAKFWIDSLTFLLKLGMCQIIPLLFHTQSQSLQGIELLGWVHSEFKVCHYACVEKKVKSSEFVWFENTDVYWITPLTAQ